MPETEIKNRLESLLKIYGLTIQVVGQEDTLLIILNRSGADHLDYTAIVDQVVDEVELSLIPVQSIQFYSRVLGEHEPDWARTIPLGHQGTGNATVIVSSARSAATVIEPPMEDLSPPTVTQVIEDASTTTIEEEEFNLPKPNIPAIKSKPKRPKPAPREMAPPVSPPPQPDMEPELINDREDNSAPTEIAVAPPKPKPKPPEPVVAPVSAPFPVQKVIAGILIIGSIITIGWMVWGKTRSKSKPKPKKAQIVIIMPAKHPYFTS